MGIRSQTFRWAALCFLFGAAAGVLATTAATAQDETTLDRWDLQDITLNKERGSIWDWNLRGPKGNWIYAGKFGFNGELQGTYWALHPPVEFVGEVLGRDALAVCADWIDQHPELQVDSPTRAACFAQVDPCMELDIDYTGHVTFGIDSSCLRARQQHRGWTVHLGETLVVPNKEPL